MGRKIVYFPTVHPVVDWRSLPYDGHASKPRQRDSSQKLLLAPYLSVPRNPRKLLPTVRKDLSAKCSDTCVLEVLKSESWWDSASFCSELGAQKQNGLAVCSRLWFNPQHHPSKGCAHILLLQIVKLVYINQTTLHVCLCYY